MDYTDPIPWRVKHLEYRTDLTLITNDEDIKVILDDIGVTDEYGCLFVAVDDGEYGDIYACRSSVPYLEYKVNKIR